MNKKNVQNYKLKSNNSGNSLKKKKQQNPIMKLGITVTAMVFVAACVFEIISTQAEIAEKRQELNALIEEAELLEDVNDEYQSMLSEDDERAFMERYAVEVLGYAYPNERRFYDTTGN
ncbi:MAG: hypothetical protein IKK42_00850 [Oscillospiraceae bacterium]|nr:hypothetical protein [Oscillospiraceae bacterium]